MCKAFSARTLLSCSIWLLVSVNAIQTSDWNQLNSTLQGRLHAALPYAQSCYSLVDGGKPHTPNAKECAAVQAGNANHTFRTSIPGAYSNTQWETCQTNDDQCLLDNTNPTNPAAFSPPRVCSQGSVPNFYIDVTGPEDVAAAFSFARKTKVQLVIKNSGHDYIGRSAAPGSLAIWTHNLRKLDFVHAFTPDGCKSVQGVPAFTIGAGQQFNEIYALAEENNVTFVGGADTTVGASGGWIQGGGHSPLSVTMGLGVDRVLQFKVVTPDGQLRTANKCTNPDLFFALRGGGGGTFGVVMESTHIVTPRVQVQTASVTFDPTEANIRSLIKALAANSVQWATDGWGGTISPKAGGAFYANAVINATAVSKSMAPLVAAVKSIGGNVTFGTSPSYPAFFNAFIAPVQDPLGMPFTISSRLIPGSSFNNTQLIDAIIDSIFGSLFPQILAVAPFSFKGFDNGTSVTPAWRDAIWHTTANNVWNFNTTMSERASLYQGLEKVMNPIRKLTPGSGAYMNEADVYEPDFQNSFWGGNYPRLLQIKQKYDPEGLLDCWHCVGWKGPQDPRYKCYMAI
ncbi:FAD-binding domain-containing protein [Infundibulicybe gibba]|nr:FAD-binding domain-containing protein [Infundibulicybe gibba]